MSEPIKVKSISQSELKHLFNKNIFAIPDLQREFIWTKKKIVTLLDSIKKHYPIGSFLICKIPVSKAKGIKESAALPKFDEKNNRECYLVVDGQQRLSVIYSVMFGKPLHNQRYQDAIDARTICLSKREKNESEFEFYDMTKGKNITLHDILSDNVEKKHQKDRRVIECKRAFDKYTYPFIFINEFDQEKMEEAFIRLNTGGTSLSTLDRIFAEAYHKDTDLRRHCNHLVIHELSRGFESTDQGFIVKAIAVNLGQRDFVSSSIHTFAKKLSNPRNSYHIEYKKKHKKIFDSIKLAADFLTKRFRNAYYIPYPIMLTILSVFYYNNNNRNPASSQVKEIERWFWTTAFARRYSGSNQKDNLINDAGEMKKLAESEKYAIKLEGKHPVEEISVKKILQTRYNKRGAIKNAFFCYLLSKRPREFKN